MGTGDISLGRNQKFGKINFEKLKAGIKESEIKDAKQIEVFKKLDKNNNGVIEQNELQELIDNLGVYADHGKITKREAKKYLKENNVTQDAKNTDLLEFLNQIGIISDDINQVVNSEFNGSKTINIEHNPDDEGNILTEILNSQDGAKLAEQTETQDGVTITEFFDEEGNPASTTLQKGAVTQYLDKDGRLIKQETNKGAGGIETIEYEYDEQGNVTKATTTNPDGTVTVKEAGKKTVDETSEEDSTLKQDENTNERLVTYAIEDENFTQTAERLGLKKGTPEYEEFMKANEKAAGRSHGGWFKVGEEVIIPESLKDKVNQDEILTEEQGQAETQKYNDKMAAKAEAQAKAKAEAERQEREYYQKLGVKSFNDRGKKIKAKLSGGKETEVEIIGQLKGYGRQLVKKGNKLYTISHDNVILREDYIQAHKAFVSKPKTQRNNTVSGQKDVTYVKDNNGKVWYFNEKTGKAIVKDDYKKVVKQESAFVANQLHTAAKGMGTDEKLLEKGVKNIYSRDILNNVNAELKTKDSDYVGDAQTMPVEALILDEMSHSTARPLFKTLIDSGVMTTEEKAHTVKREIEHEIQGYTSTSDLNEVMQLCTDRDVRLEVEKQLKKDHPELTENEGSFVRSYIAGDGWNEQEVDQFDANWIKTGAYQEARYVYQTDKDGNIVFDEQGQPVVVLDKGDQDHRNSVIGRLVFDYQDKEALNKGLDAINDNPDSFDYQSLDTRAGQEVAKDPNGKYQSRFNGQDNVQRYLSGFHSDESGDVDVGNLSASNTCLFKGVKPARIQAEEALYDAKKGDYSKAFDSMDSETYTAMSELIADGDIKGVKDMTELYNKALNSATKPNDKIKIKANAMISGQVEFSDKEKTEFCLNLMHSIDANAGIGSSIHHDGVYQNIADYEKAQLQAILQQNPQILNEVKAKAENEKFESVSSKAYGSTGDVYITSINTKSEHLEFLNNIKTIGQEEIFLDKDGKKITDSEQIELLKQANMQSLNEMRKYVAELERDFKKGVDSEGLLSDMANGLSEFSGLGTDRGDVATEYRNAKIMLQQFEAAAQGKLRDSDGNIISAQDLAQQMMDKQNELAQTNSDYKSTIAYGKMGIVLAPVIVATTVATGGAGAAGWGTLGVATAGGVAAGATTYGVNALEYNTSYTGNTAEAREQNLEDSIVNGVATGIGIGQMKYIGNMANNMGTVARTSVRLGTTVAADTSAGVGAEYLTTGDISKQGFISNMIMSGVGNIIGAKSLGEKHVSTKPKVETGDTPNLAGRDAIADGVVARNIDKQHLSANERKMVEEGLKDVPTPEEHAKYHEEMKFKPVSEDDMPAYKAHQDKVAQDYKEAHELGNMVDEKSLEALNRAKSEPEIPVTPATPKSNAEVTALENEIKGLEGIIRKLDQQIFGAKKMGKNTSKLEAQVENLKSKLEAKNSKLKGLKETPVVEVKSEPEVKIEAEVKPQTPQTPVLTSEDRMALGQIGNNINRAKSLDDLAKVQAWLDKMPECSQKTALQNRINEKSASFKANVAEPEIEVFLQATPGDKLTKEVATIVDDNAVLVLANKVELDLSSPEIKAKLDSLKEGQTITVGREGDIRIADNSRSISRKHLEITKQDGQIIVKDLSTNGTTVGKAKPQYNNGRVGQRPEVQGRPDLDKYVLSDRAKNEIDYRNMRSSHPMKSHEAFYDSRPDLFGSDMHDYGFWRGYTPKGQHHGPWKMHLFSVDEADWEKMSDVLIPYLREHDVDWKTFNKGHSPEMLDGNQAGKAFTVYPKNNEDMAQIAKDLDYIIRKNGLDVNGSNITGDRQMGDSGRLFYRYEFKSGRYADEILDLGNTSDYNIYRYERYESNRGNGGYLASDMSPADDIWLNFDPSKY